MKDLADRLELTPPAVSISVRRGEKLVKEFGYRLTHEYKVTFLPTSPMAPDLRRNSLVVFQ